jgi:3(or 17)beta-hydroxysteroid dehydrogenase
LVKQRQNCLPKKVRRLLLQVAALNQYRMCVKNTNGGKAIAITQDVSDEAGWDSVIEQIINQFGQLDVVVNNAGIAIPGNVEELSLDDFEATQKINTTGVFLGVRAAVKSMKENGGAIINVSSIEGIVGDQNAAAYNASKGAVGIYTKSAALHCANNGYNIRVNSLHPGYIVTPMVTDLGEAMGAEAAQEFMAGILAKIPMGCMAQPSEMASGLLFLACDDSSYMTGSELVMDGGYIAH